MYLFNPILCHGKLDWWRITHLGEDSSIFLKDCWEMYNCSDASFPASLSLVSTHTVLTILLLLYPFLAQVHTGSSGPGDASPRRPEGQRMADIQWPTGLRRWHLCIRHSFNTWKQTVMKVTQGIGRIERKNWDASKQNGTGECLGWIPGDAISSQPRWGNCCQKASGFTSRWPLGFHFLFSTGSGHWMRPKCTACYWVFHFSWFLL